jgi:hypothetical protein
LSVDRWMRTPQVVEFERDAQEEEEQKHGQEEECFKKEGGAKEKGALEEDRTKKEGGAEETKGARKEPERGIGDD